MSNSQHNILGNIMYCAGGWSQSLAKDLKQEKVNALELLDDWPDFSCFEGYADKIECLKVCGGTENGRISALNNIDIFKGLKKLRILSKVKKPYDLTKLRDLELIDAVWQPSLSTAFSGDKLNNAIINSVDDSFFEHSIENSYVEQLWLARPKVDSLNLLEYFPGLTSLRLTESNKIKSLNGLAYCNGIEKVDIEGLSKLTDGNELRLLDKLKYLRMMKVSPDFDVSVFDEDTSIERISFCGPKSPTLPWATLLKSSKIRAVYGWWGKPFNEEEILGFLPAGIKPKKIENTAGTKNNPAITVELLIK